MTKSLENLAGGEKTFVRAYVKELLSHGLFISVNDGEEWVLKRCTVFSKIIDALGSTCEDRLMVRDAAGEKIGSLYFVYGNDESGCEVLADYSVSVEPYISATWAKALAA